MKWLQAGMYISVMLMAFTAMGLSIGTHIARSREPQFSVSVGPSSVRAAPANSARCGARFPYYFSPALEDQFFRRDAEIKLSRCWEPV